MRRMPPVVLFSALAAISVSACQEKMGVEKRAEEIEKAKAQEKAAMSASAAAPDPREEQYGKARKAVLDRTKAHLAALQKMYEGVSEEERTKFRDYFAPTKEGEKEADELSKEAVFAGKQGMALKRY
jgi:hypothetical protein